MNIDTQRPEMEYNLEKALQVLNIELQKQNSFLRSFLLGLVKGFAMSIGATVVFALVFALLFQFARTVDYVPIINSFLTSQAVEEVLNNFAGGK